MVAVADAFSFEKDVEELIDKFPGLTDSFIPIERIGEGTFSVVYKAIDVRHHQCDNSSWISYSLQDPDDFLLFDRSMIDKLNPKTKIQTILKDYFKNTLKSCQQPYFVALKRINMTSNPDRVKDELLFLKELNGSQNVVPLITALRYEDQIIAVYPYFKHDDFRDYFYTLSVSDIQHYMKSLLIALRSVHGNGIIHRDLKPNNFLYSVEQQRGILVDFGLAQREPDGLPRVEPKKMCMRSKVTIPLSRDGNSILYSPNALNSLKRPAPGYYLNDVRHAMKANRAGTRGFRAPEVLFKHGMQSRAIDIWSVGVIFLCLLTQRYPFFNSPDDQDALVEIACIVGTNSLEKVASLCDRTWKHSLPDVPTEHAGFEAIVKSLNPELAERLPCEAYDFAYKLMAPNWFERLTAEEALRHPFLVMSE